jgi:hypothetical protein
LSSVRQNRYLTCVSCNHDRCCLVKLTRMVDGEVLDSNDLDGSLEDAQWEVLRHADFWPHVRDTSKPLAHQPSRATAPISTQQSSPLRPAMPMSPSPSPFPTPRPGRNKRKTSKASSSRPQKRTKLSEKQRQFERDDSEELNSWLEPKVKPPSKDEDGGDIPVSRRRAREDKDNAGAHQQPLQRTSSPPRRTGSDSGARRMAQLISGGWLNGA